MSIKSYILPAAIILLLAIIISTRGERPEFPFLADLIVKNSDDNITIFEASDIEGFSEQIISSLNLTVTEMDQKCKDDPTIKIWVPHDLLVTAHSYMKELFGAKVVEFIHHEFKITKIPETDPNEAIFGCDSLAIINPVAVENFARVINVLYGLPDTFCQKVNGFANGNVYAIQERCVQDPVGENGE